jgi:glycerate kinase
MRVLVASDSFKGSLSSGAVGSIIAEELESALPGVSCESLCVGDGGEGTLEAVVASCDGKTRTIRATGPMGDAVEATFAVLPGRRAYIESAAACGLTLVDPARRDPWQASTAGVGELIRAALDEGCRDLTIGVGGSATCDGGAGMAAALGARLLDEEGHALAGRGRDLGRVREVDISGLDRRLSGCSVHVMCDVENPLCGADGAIAVFGPQKGVAPSDIAPFDAGMARWADAVARAIGRDLSCVPGAGAAGGLAFGLAALASAELVSGIECVLDLVGFDQALAGARLVVTGEGHLDAQTAQGKVVAGVAARSKAAGVPCIAIVGGADADALGADISGLDAVVPCVTEPCSTEQALGSAERNLRLAARRVAALLSLGGKVARP